MTTLQPESNPFPDRDSAQESAAPAWVGELCVRLWAYGGPQRKLRDMAWGDDAHVQELVSSLGDGQGKLVQNNQNILVIHFTDPLRALSAAKMLQQKLLTSLSKVSSTDQPVAAMMVRARNPESKPDNCTSDSPTTVIEPADLLLETNAAQILVSEQVHELAKNLPGFQFSSKPAREAGEGGAAETIYELMWTDESTYGHLRKTSTEPDLNKPRESRYQIVSELGRGSMGVVYKAYDQVIGRTVALKTISVSRNFPDRDELVERLKREAKAAGSLDHPNIITIFDVGQEDDLVYLSMQFVEGETLMDLLGKGNLPPLSNLLDYAQQICSGVGFAHKRGVIHRDLKPANVMVASHGMIKILDFGIAKFGDATATQAGMIIGTPNYMAPEQATGKKVDHRSDIFSLGSVFYELFTREKPFKGDVTAILYKLVNEDPVPPSVINPALPGGLDAIIRKAMAKNPAERFQSCEELQQALRQQAAWLGTAGAAQTNAAKPAAAPKPETKPVTVEDLLAEAHPPRSKGVVWMSMAVLLVAIAGIAAWAYQARVRTGAFPPLVQKILAKVRGTTAVPNAVNNSQPSSPPATNSTSQGAPNSAGTATTPSDQSSAQPTAATTSNPADTNSTAAAAAGTPANATQPANPADTSAKPADAATTQATSGSGAGDQSSSVEKDKSQPEEENPFRPRSHTQKKSAAATTDNSGVTVEGFNRRDIPDLLSRADAAAGRGDYSLARYEYNLVLRLDRQNAAARQGLKRVIAAEQAR
jgi:serine/threonine-protein kinase